MHPYEYVALQPIDIDGVRAFNVGDPVPAQHVKDFELSDEQVAKADSEKAEAVQTPPAKSASREEWATWALDVKGAAASDVEGKSRDELAKLYG